MSDTDDTTLNSANSTLPPVSMSERRRELQAEGEAQRAQYSGEPDIWGAKVQSLSAEASEAIEPIATAWAERTAEKHPLPEGMSWEQWAEINPSLHADAAAAREMYEALTEGRAAPTTRANSGRPPA